MAFLFKSKSTAGSTAMPGEPSMLMGAATRLEVPPTPPEESAPIHWVQMSDQLAALSRGALVAKPHPVAYRGPLLPRTPLPTPTSSRTTPLVLAYPSVICKVLLREASSDPAQMDKLQFPATSRGGGWTRVPARDAGQGALRPAIGHPRSNIPLHSRSFPGSLSPLRAFGRSLFQTHSRYTHNSSGCIRNSITAREYAWRGSVPQRCS